MPPRANKKKGKSSKPDATEVGSAVVPSHDLEDQFHELSKEWEVSPQNEHLASQVRHTLLSQEHISIDNALCLGLGSMEMAQLKPLPGWPKVSHTFRDQIPLEWQGATLSGEWDEKGFGPVAKGRKRNNSLYQLMERHGSDLVSATVNRWLHEDNRVKHLMDDFTNFVLSSDFANVAAFGGAIPEEFGFAWTIDLGDEKVSNKLEARNSVVINAELDGWRLIDEMLAKKRVTQVKRKK